MSEHPFTRLALGLLFLALPAIVRADDGPSVADEDEALLRRLVEQSTTEGTDSEPGGESLTGTIDRMRQVAERIGDQSDTSTETRDLQRRVVADLDRLLELAKQQQRQQRNAGNPPPQPRDPRPRPDEPQPNPGEAEPQPMPTEAGATSGEGERRRDDDDASESTDLTDPGEDREAQLAERRRLVKDVWGHLPPRMREELMNLQTEEPLPKYEDLVNAYFRALAERSRRDD